MSDGIYETLERLEHLVQSRSEAEATALDRGELAILCGRLGEQLVAIVARAIPFDLLRVANEDRLYDPAPASARNDAHVSRVMLTEDGEVLIGAALDDLIDEAVDAALDERDMLADANVNRLMIGIAGGEYLADLGLLASIQARVHHGGDPPSACEKALLEDLLRRIAPVAERLLSRYIAAGFLAVTNGEGDRPPRPVIGLQGYDGTHVVLKAAAVTADAPSATRRAKRRRPS